MFSAGCVSGHKSHPNFFTFSRFTVSSLAASLVHNHVPTFIAGSKQACGSRPPDVSDSMRHQCLVSSPPPIVRV